MRSLDARRVGGLLLPYLVLVLIHLLSGLQMEQPLILADEVGYLGPRTRRRPGRTAAQHERILVGVAKGLLGRFSSAP
jgi:hypothetical protein